MIDQKQIKSLTVLGWNFFLHWLKAGKNFILRKKENQAEKFKGYFKADWITALKPEEAELIYNLGKCTVCGICDEACLPSFYSQGKFLGPEHLVACAGRSQPEFISDLDDFFRCTLCAKCDNICPPQVKISELARLMRKWIFRVEPSETWAIFPEVKKNLDQFGNPFGKEKPVPEQSQTNNGVILFLGCREMAEGNPEQWIKLIESLGISAKVISGVCCGGLLEEIGAEGITPGWEKLLAHNPQKIITICPHCFYSLSKKLPEKIELKFILELIPEGLKISEKPKEPVVYFDPCFLSRKMNLGELPRRMMKNLGMELIEMEQNSILGDCCGAGGGLFWYDPVMAKRISGKKIQQAKALGAKTILTECGLCQNLLQKANSENNIEIKRLTELFFKP